MAKKLTAMQADFVRAISKGFAPTAAAEVAGSSAPSVAAHGWMRNPRVLEAIHQARQVRIQGDLSHVALDTMDDLLRNGPAAQRFQAAKWILEEAGHGQDSRDGAAGDQTPLEEMDAAQLQDVIANGHAALDQLATQLQGGHIIDGQIRQIRDVIAGEAGSPEEDLSFLD